MNAACKKFLHDSPLMWRNLENKGGPRIHAEFDHVIGTVFTSALPTPIHRFRGHIFGETRNEGGKEIVVNKFTLKARRGEGGNDAG